MFTCVGAFAHLLCIRDTLPCSDMSSHYDFITFYHDGTTLHIQDYRLYPIMLLLVEAIQCNLPVCCIHCRVLGDMTTVIDVVGKKILTQLIKKMLVLKKQTDVDIISHCVNRYNKRWADSAYQNLECQLMNIRKNYNWVYTY